MSLLLAPHTIATGHLGALPSVYNVARSRYRFGCPEYTPIAVGIASHHPRDLTWHPNGGSRDSPDRPIQY